MFCLKEPVQLSNLVIELHKKKKHKIVWMLNQLETSKEMKDMERIVYTV